MNKFQNVHLGTSNENAIATKITFSQISVFCEYATSLHPEGIGSDMFNSLAYFLANTFLNGSELNTAWIEYIVMTACIFMKWLY